MISYITQSAPKSRTATNKKAHLGLNSGGQDWDHGDVPLNTVMYRLIIIFLPFNFYIEAQRESAKCLTIDWL